jgi:hypothetical protein
MNLIRFKLQNNELNMTDLYFSVEKDEWMPLMNHPELARA